MSSPSPLLRPVSARLAGLDALRAVAVTLVVVAHLFGPVLPGGFIGVDVFFVLSGFLITTLLLREHESTGRIALGAFWQRRARRLLPALALVVTVCSTAAWVVGGDVLVDLGTQVLGAATFSYNWVSIAGDTSYFGAATPELFRNFWSLAVEEQFYLLWPLILPLVLLLPRTWARTAAVTGVAAASAVWMGAVAASGDVTRAYFGTDTHAFGILLGVALAFALAPRLRRGPDASVRAIAVTRRATTVVGAVAVAGLVTLAVVPPSLGPATFPGTVLAASLLTVAAIGAAVWPGSAFGPAIDVPLARWVGERSYGIYLWHWPLLVLVVAVAQGTGPEAGIPVWASLVVLALTLAASEASYRVVEMPVRRHGFRGAVRLTSQTRLAAASAVTAGVLVLGGTSAAIAEAPEVTSSESVVTAGARALKQIEVPDASPSPAPTVHGQNGRGIHAPQPPTPVTGDQITAVGDSVMLASAPSLLARFPGIHVDAAVSRSAWAGPEILETLNAQGALREYVVLALGTNGPVATKTLDRMVDIAGPDRVVVLVNAYAERDWIPGVNAELADYAATHPRVWLADWAGAIAPREDLLAGDRIHPGTAGGDVFAETVAATIADLQQERYERDLRYYENLRDRPLPRAE